MVPPKGFLRLPVWLLTDANGMDEAAEEKTEVDTEVKINSLRFLLFFFSPRPLLFILFRFLSSSRSLPPRPMTMSVSTVILLSSCLFPSVFSSLPPSSPTPVSPLGLVLLS